VSAISTGNESDKAAWKLILGSQAGEQPSPGLARQDG
jgi:hypothetical protein